MGKGKEVPTCLPSTLEEFLLAQQLLPRSVVVEHNGQAIAPSEFSRRQLAAGDRLEIVKIVAGGGGGLELTAGGLVFSTPPPHTPPCQRGYGTVGGRGPPFPPLLTY